MNEPARPPGIPEVVVETAPRSQRPVPWKLIGALSIALSAVFIAGMYAEAAWVDGGFHDELDEQELLNYRRMVEASVKPVPTEAFTPTISEAEFADEVIRLSNEERVKAGLTPLVKNELLTISAAAKLDEILNFGYWSHYNPAGEAPWAHITRAGYHYQLAGENLAISFKTPAGVVTGWMKSETHRKNLLTADYQDIGVAVHYGQFFRSENVLVSQHFGRR